MVDRHLHPAFIVRHTCEAGVPGRRVCITLLSYRTYLMTNQSETRTCITLLSYRTCVLICISGAGLASHFYHTAHASYKYMSTHTYRKINVDTETPKARETIHMRCMMRPVQPWTEDFGPSSQGAMAGGGIRPGLNEPPLSCTLVPKTSDLGPSSGPHTNATRQLQAQYRLRSPTMHVLGMHPSAVALPQTLNHGGPASDLGPRWPCLRP